MSDRYVIHKWNDNRKDWFSVDDSRMEVEVCRSTDEEQAKNVARLLNSEALEISEHKDFLRVALKRRAES